MKKKQIVQELLSSEQNKATHILYITIQNAVAEIYQMMKESHVNVSNLRYLFPLIYIQNQFELSTKTSHSFSKVSRFVLRVKLPERVMKVFPEISNGEPYFNIVFALPEHLPANATAAIVADKNTNIPYDIVINTGYLMKSQWSSICGTLQHEIQHIPDSFDEELKKINHYEISPEAMATFDGTINYLADPSEINSFAKQTVYFFRKKYLKNETIDLDKIKSLISHDAALNFALPHYLYIFSNPVLAKKMELIPSDYKLTQQNVDKMRATHDNFMRELTRSLNYFVKVPPKYTLEETKRSKSNAYKDYYKYLLNN